GQDKLKEVQLEQAPQGPPMESKGKTSRPPSAIEKFESLIGNSKSMPQYLVYFVVIPFGLIIFAVIPWILFSKQDSLSLFNGSIRDSDDPVEVGSAPSQQGKDVLSMVGPLSKNPAQYLVNAIKKENLSKMEESPGT